MSLEIYIKQLNDTMQELVKLKEEKEQKKEHHIQFIYKESTKSNDLKYTSTPHSFGVTEYNKHLTTSSPRTETSVASPIDVDIVDNESKKEMLNTTYNLHEDNNNNEMTDPKYDMIEVNVHNEIQEEIVNKTDSKNKVTTQNEIKDKTSDN